MAKYILHGGATGVDNEHNKAFYQEWVKDFDEGFTPTILLVYFSREDNEYQFLESSERERFAKATNNRQVDFVIANSDMNTFKDQVSDADVVYFRGGSTEKLMEALLSVQDELLGMFAGKVVAGSSAGVMFLSHYTCSDRADWQKCFGLLPINSYVHWSEEYRQKLNDFEQGIKDNDFEMILLPETEFVTREF